MPSFTIIEEGRDRALDVIRQGRELLDDGRIPDFPEQCVGKDGL